MKRRRMVSGSQSARKRRRTMPITITRVPKAPLATRGYRTPIRGELKVFDTVSTTALTTTWNFDANGTLFNIFNPTAGSDFINRIGRKTNITSIQFRGGIVSDVALDPAATPYAMGGQLLRVIIFFDTQPNGALTTVSELLQSAAAGAGVSNIFSNLNMNNRDRFKIIRDKVYSIDPYAYVTTATQAVSSMSNQVKSIKIFKKGLNLETVFSASTGAIGDISSGALNVCIIGNDPAGGAHFAKLFGQFRCRFRDL